MGVLHGWATCPRCAASLEGGGDALRCPACGSHYYANSAPTASAVIEDGDGRVLLGRRALEPFRGYWDTVGGFLHEGEAPEVGLRREVCEETGLEIEIGQFLGVWMDRYGAADTAVHTLNLFWVARVVGGELAPADDVSELAWFASDALPPADELAFAAIEHVLAAWRSRQ
ncbi:MAG: NUDIX domain-containing protein [Gaiellales bacterium]